MKSKFLYIIVSLFFVIIIGLVLFVWTVPNIRTIDLKKTGKEWISANQYEMILKGIDNDKNINIQMLVKKTDNLDKSYVILESFQGLKKHLSIFTYTFDYQKKETVQGFLQYDDTFYQNTIQSGDEFSSDAENLTDIASYFGNILSNKSLKKNSNGYQYVASFEEQLQLAILFQLVTTNFYNDWYNQETKLTYNFNIDQNKLDYVQVCFNDCNKKEFKMYFDMTKSMPEF